MNLIATLVSDSRTAYKILREIPPDSVVLIPESVDLNHSKIIKFSRDKGLFIVYNQDTMQNGKRYITMQGVDNGELKWTVSKFKLYKTDFESGFSPSRAEFIVDIRGHVGAVFICLDLSVIGRDGKLFAVGNVLKNYNVEILMLPSNWQYNYQMVSSTMQTAIENIPSLKVALFSNTSIFAKIKTKKETRRITSPGFTMVEV